MLIHVPSPPLPTFVLLRRQGGPFVFCVSGIPPCQARVCCRLKLQLVQWADPDKQRLLLPDYIVQRDDVDKQQLQHVNPLAGQGVPPPHASPPAPLNPAHNAQGSAHPTTTGDTSPALSGLPTDFKVAAALDAAGLPLLPCHAHSAPACAWAAVPPGSRGAELGVKGEATGGGGVGPMKQEGETEPCWQQGAGRGGACEAAGHRGGTQPAGGCTQETGVCTESMDPSSSSRNVNQSSSGGCNSAAGTCPRVAVSGQGFQVITYVAQVRAHCTSSASKVRSGASGCRGLCAGGPCSAGCIKCSGRRTQLMANG